MLAAYPLFALVGLRAQRCRYSRRKKEGCSSKLQNRRTMKLKVLLTTMCAFIALLAWTGLGLRSQQSAFTVSGTLTGGPPTLRGRQGTTLAVLLEGSVASGPTPKGSIIDRIVKRVSLRSPIQSDGSFAFSNVPPGMYRLTTYVDAAQQQSIPTIVVTDHDVSGVKIALIRDNVVTDRRNLDLTWSLPGPWSGVAAAPNDGIYVGVPGDPLEPSPFAKPAPMAHIRHIDFNGKTLLDIPTAGFRSTKFVLFPVPTRRRLRCLSRSEVRPFKCCVSCHGFYLTECHMLVDSQGSVFGIVPR